METKDIIGEYVKDIKDKQLREKHLKSWNKILADFREKSIDELNKMKADHDKYGGAQDIIWYKTVKENEAFRKRDEYFWKNVLKLINIVIEEKSK